MVWVYAVIGLILQSSSSAYWTNFTKQNWSTSWHSKNHLHLRKYWYSTLYVNKKLNYLFQEKFYKWQPFEPSSLVNRNSCWNHLLWQILNCSNCEPIFIGLPDVEKFLVMCKFYVFDGTCINNNKQIVPVSSFCSWGCKFMGEGSACTCSIGEGERCGPPPQLFLSKIFS